MTRRKVEAALGPWPQAGEIPRGKGKYTILRDGQQYATMSYELSAVVYLGMVKDKFPEYTWDLQKEEE